MPSVQKDTATFTDPCDSRIVDTCTSNVRDSAVKAVSTARLNTGAIMDKIGTIFTLFFRFFWKVRLVGDGKTDATVPHTA